MIFRIDAKHPGDIRSTERCTIQFLAQILKLSLKEQEQFRNLGVGEALDCGNIMVKRVA